jgi:eukaryotic-like serine/threonine-protein kinase
MTAVSPSVAFGPYTLDRPLAQGGMADLYAATHIESGTPVVVKRLKPDLEGRDDIVDLFLTEADIGQLLHHENVIRVLDAGELDARYYLVMEYADGVDADHILYHAWQQRTPIDVGVALRIAIDGLRGLHFAHTLKSPQGTSFGLIHRDVSPDNLFVLRNGMTKVADFGIAKLSSLEGATQAGVIKGKVSFMSPEQVSGVPLDGRADGYSLALVLFEMLSSHRPFGPREGEGEVELVMRVRKGDVPSLRTIDERVPKPIAKAVDKMLRRWRYFRHDDCAAFADALERAAIEAAVDTGRAGVAAVVEAVQKSGVSRGLAPGST